jgi:Fur family zinc uptake transcriptional regulator
MSAPRTVFDDHDHTNCQHSTLSQAEALAEAKGLRLTPVRRRTLEILLAEHRAMGAYEVLDVLKSEGFGAQPPVAYRALDFLVEHGLAHKVRRLNAFTACTNPGAAHRPMFLICRACDTVAEAASEPVQAAVSDAAQALDFTVERVNVEVLGLCPACRDQDPCR